MPTNLPAGGAAAIESDVLVLSVLRKISRRDGVTNGRTNADAPITYGGLEYRKARLLQRWRDIEQRASDFGGAVAVLATAAQAAAVRTAGIAASAI